MTERLDRIEQSIERLSTALDVIVTEFIRPSAQQTAANYERLNRVDETLRQTNATLDRVAQQQERNTADIDALLGAISTTDVEVRSLSVRAAETDTRFNILIQEMRADRRASQQAFQALLLQLASLNGRVDELEQAS
jgi:chromosome segregation ATPase